jgi:hypothetical protein
VPLATRRARSSQPKGCDAPMSAGTIKGSAILPA